MQLKTIIEAASKVYDVIDTEKGSMLRFYETKKPVADRLAEYLVTELDGFNNGRPAR